MKSIAIQFSSLKPLLINKTLEYHGELIINGAVADRFLSNTSWWNKDEYVMQWKDGLERIKMHNISCLIIDITDPRKKPFVEFYCLYKNDKTIHIQARGLFGDNYRDKVGLKPFNLETCYDFIPLQSEGDADEWYVSNDI